MSTDVTGIAVALVGVVGTLGATALTQRSAARGKQLDAEIQRRDRAEERQEAARMAAHDEKRAVYADLNAAARHFRTVALDHVLDRQRGGAGEVSGRLDEARTRYRDIYARAQMVLSDRALAVASEVNLCLGHGYRAVREIENGVGGPEAVGDVRGWLDGPVSDGVWLLRRVLREDLGVVEPSPDIETAAASLRDARKARSKLANGG